MHPALSRISGGRLPSSWGLRTKTIIMFQFTVKRLHIRSAGVCTEYLSDMSMICTPDSCCLAAYVACFKLASLQGHQLTQAERNTRAGCIAQYVQPPPVSCRLDRESRQQSQVKLSSECWLPDKWKLPWELRLTGLTLPIQLDYITGFIRCQSSNCFKGRTARG